jgi:signal peptidase I
MEQFSTSPVSVPLGRAVQRRLGRRMLGLAVLAVAALGLAMHENVSNFRVTSDSMEPTLQVGQRLTASSSGAPAIGDIVVFHPPVGARASDPVCGASDQGTGSAQACDASVPQESSAIFVKRVVGGPGDVISIRGGHVIRNGVPESDPYIAPCQGGDACTFPTPVRVPAGEYYLLGDNRGVSDDSRFWGPVPSTWIIGTVVHCALLDTLCRPLR